MSPGFRKWEGKARDMGLIRRWHTKREINFIKVQIWKYGPSGDEISYDSVRAIRVANDCAGNLSHWWKIVNAIFRG